MRGILDELKELAAERSSPKRLQLLHRISDLFIEAGGSRTDAENYLFNDILEKIIDQISPDAKIQVSANLATLQGFPAGIVRAFARDNDINIARPVLRGSSVLSDNDLVGIAMTRGQDHLHAIAARDRLSTVITDVLIDRGNQRVVQRVSANHGAQFSNWGFEQLVEKASKDVNLQEILVDRPDLGQEVVDKLLPLISETLAFKLAERGYTFDDAAVAPDLMRSIRERFAEALRERKADIRSITALTELVACGELTVDQALSEIVTGDRLLDVATLMASAAKLDRSDVFGLFIRGEFQMLMLFFRALEISWSNFERVMALRAQKLRIPSPASADVARDYEALDPSLAQRTIRFLQVRHKLAKSDGETLERRFAGM